jgi:hypothetical protein
MVKFIAVVGVLCGSYALGYPIFHWWVEWFEDVNRFLNDPIWAASYSTSAKVFYGLFPMVFAVPVLLWYGIVFRQHRKTYYACGWPQGTVMWVFNKPGTARGHIYDLFSALHGFKEIPWEDVRRPFTGTFFDGKTVIYWRSSIWQGPFSWNKDIVTNPGKNFRESLTTVFAVADRRVMRRHRFNPKCDYNLLTDDDLYLKQDKDLAVAMEREKSLNYQITEDVQRLARANPDVANNMAHRDIPIPRTTREKLIQSKEVSNGKAEKKVPDGAHEVASD